VRLGEVLVVGPVAFDEVGDRVEPQPVHPHVEPEVHDVEHLAQHLGIVEVEVGLVAVEAVPEVLLGHRVPGPVRGLGVGEDDPRLGPFVRIVRPDVEVALGAAPRRGARALEPRVLVGSVVDDELGDDLEPAPVRFLDEAPEVVHVAVGGVDLLVFGDVVAVVPEGRGVEREEPDGRRAQFLHMVEPLHQALEVAHAVAVGILERLHVQLVYDGVLVPVGGLHDGLGRALKQFDVHAPPPGGVIRQMA
jgi:hypothetical protein